MTGAITGSTARTTSAAAAKEAEELKQKLQQSEAKVEALKAEITTSQSKLTELAEQVRQEAARVAESEENIRREHNALIEKARAAHKSDVKSLEEQVAQLEQSYHGKLQDSDRARSQSVGEFEQKHAELTGVLSAL